MEKNVKPAALNDWQCRLVANAIKPLTLKKDFYSRPYLNVDADNETRFRMHFFAVAICHQTHQLYHPVLNIYGWDFIEYVFITLAQSNHQLLHPDFLRLASLPEIAKKLEIVFSHSGDTEKCSLDRLDERAKLMKDTAEFLCSNFDGKVSEIFEGSKNTLVSGGGGLYAQLSRMEAFADPQQKKSTFLIKLLEEDGLVKIHDPENFIPIMDYHMQRVLLRLGCVEITDDTLRDKLLKRTILDTDEPIRQLCIDAFKIIAENSGHPITKMNDFFWSLGRSCCHETTLCIDKTCSKTPCTFTEIVEVPDHSRCVFQEICKGAANESHRKLWQPVVNTHFY